MGRGVHSATAGAADMGAAVKAAEGAAIFDEIHYVDDKAVYDWLKAHRLPGHGHDDLVMGTRRSAPLLFTWPRRSFRTLPKATGFLAGIARDQATLAALNRIGRELRPPVGGGHAVEVAAALAPALMTGEVWATDVPRPPVKDWVGKPDPSVFATMGRGYTIDFMFAVAKEGGQWLRGYVPFGRNGTIGASGMTVASGFDLGQWSRRQFDDMDFPKALADKLRAFVGIPFAHLHKGRKATPMSRDEVLALLLRLGPPPVLTKDEADVCDKVVFGRILSGAVAAWDTGRKPGVPAFAALPGGWQTVWLSRFYNEGPAPQFADAKTFRAHARAGEWAEAVAALRGYRDPRMASRAREEAGLLARALPPELPRPAARGTPAAPAARPRP